MERDYRRCAENKFRDGCCGKGLAGGATASRQTSRNCKPAGRAYLFRGALGPIFSRGMDRLTKKRIEEAGVTATVNEFTICRYIAAKAIRDYRLDPAPIILIGHSMGGFCATKFAEILQAENIPVSLVVTIDPAHVACPTCRSMSSVSSTYLAHNVLGGGDVVPAKGYLGHYASFDLSQHDEVTHINIDKMGSVHEQLVAKIQELTATPAKAEGEGLPPRYVVPADTAIELWDSGTLVFAHPGDTLETLAVYYGVPLWSLTQTQSGAGRRTAHRPPAHRDPTTPCSALGGLGAAPAQTLKRAARQPLGTPLVVRQEWNQHWDATAVGPIGIRTEFNVIKRLSMRASCHRPSEISTAPSIAVIVPNPETRRQDCRDESCINSMAHKSIRSGVNDLMSFFVRDRIRPKVAEMNSRPPREQDACQRHGRKRIGDAVTDNPDRRTANACAVQGGMRSAPHNRDLVGLCIPG